MKQVHRRTLLLLLLIGLLTSGTVLFCLRYVSQGDDWAAFSANDHAYTDGRLSAGQVLDRNGTLLYDAETDEYAVERTLRRATLHLVGDSGNNIATSVKAALPEAGSLPHRRPGGEKLAPGTSGISHAGHLFLRGVRFV